MKYPILAACICSFVTIGNAADPLPPELATIRGRYESALAAAAKPVRDKYIQELQQLKNRALTMKNLELAVAVDQEIKVVAAAPDVSAPSAKSAAPDEFRKLLAGTKWKSPNGKSTLEFTEQDMLWTDGDKPARPIAYISDKGGVVRWKWSDGKEQEIEFDSALKTIKPGGWSAVSSGMKRVTK